jgi:hypothetical protein
VARIYRAKQAHDSLIAEVYRAQGHSLAIRASAEMRLAEEYDAAQERGEVALGSVRTDIVGDFNDVRPATAADLGLRRDEIHETRKLLDAEAAEPGTGGILPLPRGGAGSSCYAVWPKGTRAAAAQCV